MLETLLTIYLYRICEKIYKNKNYRPGNLEKSGYSRIRK